MTRAYPTKPEALKSIAEALRSFYSSKYPQIHSGQPTAIAAAVAEVQNIYSANFFPYMKVDWRTHPNHIGHMYFPGCFHCHNGQHVSALGKVIPNLSLI